MPGARDRKLYLGPRLRMLRRELGLNQTQMADELGVSPSYLNHLERNQRPLTAPMLLRLAETYDLDVRGFVAGAGEAAASDLGEILADDLTRDLGIGRQEALEVAENYPNMAEAVKRLYRALADLRQTPGRLEAGIAQGGTASPVAWTRDWLQMRENHFADIDAAAEALSADLGQTPEAIGERAVARLGDHGVSVRVVPQDTLVDASRHYDFHRRRLLLSERLSAPSRRMAIVAQLFQLEGAGLLAEALADPAPPDKETAALAAQMIVNYAAAAIVMPYGRFHAAAEASGYDLDLLADRFGASIEQVAHRLTTLARPGTRGLRLFLLKTDTAGNVVKRFAAGAAPMANFGGGCPRWRVHQALARGGEIVVDAVETPGGDRYLTWAHAIRQFPRSQPALLVLGCDLREAGRTAYAHRAEPAPTPIGPACHLCDRRACHERALPPLTRALALDPLTRPLERYTFRTT